ncbi:ATP-binding protein [Oricola indica]|jgi:two-component system sensor histidine kinase DevS|uniref:ATP-binding protein n=1 Tax=Oricola indica TaxID=2872591 RepID=UPI001CC12BD9|nr:ATP-binding protein [Oricola indica]
MTIDDAGTGPRLAPALIVTVAAAAALVLAAIATFVAVDQPWLGLTLKAPQSGPGLEVADVSPGGPATHLSRGAVIVRITGAEGGTIALKASAPDGGIMMLEAGDLVEEPDGVASYEALDRFFERQGRIADIMRSGRVLMTLRDGTRTAIVPAQRRPLSMLSADYWLQIAVGFAGLVIGIAVWALRPYMAGARMLGISSVALVLSTYPSAIYLTRELALPEPLFRLLNTVNPFGSMAYVAALCILFLVYPRKIVPAVVPIVIACGTAAWWLLDILHLFSGPDIGRYLPVSALAVASFVTAGVQYWRAGDDPRIRAGLRWFALSLAVATGIFVIFYSVPILTGKPSFAPEAFAYTLALIVYAGLALSILQYRLFDLDRWTFRILSYVAGALAFVAFDLFLVTTIALDYLPAFGLALAMIALLYLPLRDALARQLTPPEPNRTRFFEKVVDIALTPDRDIRNDRWTGLLRQAFDPLSVEPTGECAEPVIAENGLFLRVPGYGVVAPVRVGYARGGRRLFSGRDTELADELLQMLAHAYESRLAQEKGAAEERARIARDAHDNIGAKLLSALHGSEPKRKDAMIREAISDLRDIINSSAGAPRTAEDMLAELRRETADRLSAAGLSLDWRLEEGEFAELPNSTVQSIRSIVRESVSNIIRHAGASSATVTIGFCDGTAHIEVTDDGKGFDRALETTGVGLSGMETRVRTLLGEYGLDTGPSGTTIRVALPIAMPDAST